MKIWPIYKKELRLYFTSPVAYVLLTIFLLIAGYFFYSIFAFYTMASMQSAMNPQMGRDLNVTDSVMRPLFSTSRTNGKFTRATECRPAAGFLSIAVMARSSSPF